MTALRNSIRDYQNYLRDEQSFLTQWMAGAIAFLFGVLIATFVLSSLPVNTSSLERARQLGIISRATLDGYPKQLEIPYYVFGVTITLTSAFLLFLVFTYFGFTRKTKENRTCRINPSSIEIEKQKAAMSRLQWVGLIILLAFITFQKEFIYSNWYWKDWGFFFEEGIYLRWINELLRGRVLYRDIYYYAGPFMVWPQYWLMKLFGASIAFSRLYVYLWYFIGYIIVFKVLRQIVNSKTFILLAMLLILYLYYPLLPGIQQSLGRFTISLLPLYFAYEFFCSKRRIFLIATGFCLGFALFFSQELGLGAFIAVVAMMAAYIYRERDFKVLPSYVGVIAGGAAIVILPVVSYFLLNYAFSQFYEAMVIIPRIYSMGTWGNHFPNFLTLFKATADAEYGIIEILLAYWPILFYSASVMFFLALFAKGKFNNRIVLLFGIAVLGGIMFQRAFGIYSLLKIKNAFYPAVLLSAAFLDMAWQRIRLLIAERRASGRKRELAVYGLAAIFVLGGLRGYTRPQIFLPGRLPYDYYLGVGKVYMGMPTLDIPRAKNIAVPMENVQTIRKVVKYIKDNTAADEPIYVFPYSPMYYFLTYRESPTKYEPHYSILKGTRQEVIKELEERKVKFIIYVEQGPLFGITTETSFPEICDYISKSYELDKDFGDTKILRRR